MKKLFEKVIITQEAYDEFSRIPRLKSRVDDLINDNFIEVISFEINSPVYQLFAKLRIGYLFDKEMGKGEAAAVALALKMMEF